MNHTREEEMNGDYIHNRLKVAYFNDPKGYVSKVTYEEWLERKVHDLRELLTSLRAQGAFYPSAIELDMYEKGVECYDGDEYGKMIDELLKWLK